MKNYFFVATAFFLLLGCSKQKDSISELTKEVIKQESLPAMRQAYNFLSPAEKEGLWFKKLNAVLMNDEKRITIAQKGIIDEIKGMLEEYGMEKLILNQTIGQTFLNNNLDRFKKYFSDAQIYLLIENPFYTERFSIFNAEEYLLTFQNQSVAAPPVGGTCACYYNISCGLFGYCDWKDGCTQVAECGLFGTSNCKGRC